jgi:hypothetical protein
VRITVVKTDILFRSSSLTCHTSLNSTNLPPPRTPASRASVPKPPRCRACPPSLPSLLAAALAASGFVSARPRFGSGAPASDNDGLCIVAVHAVGSGLRTGKGFRFLTPEPPVTMMPRQRKPCSESVCAGWGSTFGSHSTAGTFDAFYCRRLAPHAWIASACPALRIMTRHRRRPPGRNPGIRPAHICPKYPDENNLECRHYSRDPGINSRLFSLSGLRRDPIPDFFRAVGRFSKSGPKFWEFCIFSDVPLHQFGWCFHDVPTVLAALGPRTRAYQRNAPSVLRRHELRGHCGVHRERRCRIPWRLGDHRSEWPARRSCCARSSAAGATFPLTAAPR